MTRLDDEILMRRVDGELDPAEVARVDAAAASDPETAARLAAMRGARKAATEAFPVTTDARDRDLARMIAASGAAKASPFAGIGRALAEAFAPRRAAIWGGLATAAFVGGLALGPLLGGRTEGVQVEGGEQRRDDHRGGVAAHAGMYVVVIEHVAGMAVEEGRQERVCRLRGADHQGAAGGIAEHAA